jgi:hypothetical protein
MLNLLNRLRQEISLHLPTKRIFFIYTHRNGADRFRYGLTANTEISHWSQKALQSRFPHVVFLRIQGESERKISSITAKDVVIGHIGETYLRASERTKRVIAFCPWAGHEDRSQNQLFNCIPLEEELKYWEKASSLILLTSEFNQKHYIETDSNFWFPLFQKLKETKRIRIVHQPVDLKVFKRIKWDYTTGDFLYIGNDAHMKCLDASKKLVRQAGRKLHLYGVEGKKLNHLDALQVGKLPHQADFFIQPGMWEGQCVSMLESAARGFIPIVSRETGYPYDHPFLLEFGNFEGNLQKIKKLIQTSSHERSALGDSLHLQLSQDVHHNNWNTLTKVLIEEILESIK